MIPKDKTLKFGILCDSLSLQLWQRQVISHLLEDGHELVILVTDGSPPEPNPSFIRKVKEYPYSKLLFRLYYRFLLKPKAKSKVPIDDLTKNTWIYPEKPVKKGISSYFSEECLGAIRHSGAEFLLRFGFGIIRGEILKCTRYGVWSFHHDDPSHVRGVPSNFWEIYEDMPVNGAILQQLNESIDAGRVIWEGWFPTIRHSWKGNIDQAYFGTVLWPTQVCRDILYNNGNCLRRQESPPLSPIRLAPRNTIMIRFMARIFYNRLAFHWKDMIRTEKWAVGITRKPLSDILETGFQHSTFRWPEGNKKNEYLADPSGYWHDGKLTLLSEHYSYKNRKGEIQSANPIAEADSAIYWKTVLRTETHLAFPFVFQHKNEWYCIPETSETRQIQLYRIQTASGTLEWDCILAEGMQAVDTILFPFEDRWWLFFTEKSNSNSVLHAWYSKDLRGPYHSHINNPVKTDIRSSRPAGAVIHSEKGLIRPAQDCSKWSGRRIAINQITELSPWSFHESTIRYLESPSHPIYNQGIHTLNSAGPFTLIDAKYHCFIVQHLLHKIYEKPRTLLKKRQSRITGAS